LPARADFLEHRFEAFDVTFGGVKMYTAEWNGASKG
jgi:hypothetical protein